MVRYYTLPFIGHTTDLKITRLKVKNKGWIEITKILSYIYCIRVNTEGFPWTTVVTNIPLQPDLSTTVTETNMSTKSFGSRGAYRLSKDDPIHQLKDNFFFLLWKIPFPSEWDTQKYGELPLHILTVYRIRKE